MESPIQIASDLLATKWYLVATSAVLLYDYLLTLPNEINYAWNGNRKSIVFALFIWNRYFSLCSCILVLFTYFSPLFTEAMFVVSFSTYPKTHQYDSCNRYAVFLWVQTILIVVPAEVILTLRVYALTGRKWYIVALLVPITLLQVAFGLFVVTQKGNNALPTPDWAIDEFHVCILFPALSIGTADTTVLASSLAFDSLVFGLTLILTFKAMRKHNRTPVLVTLQRDGIIYFVIIFTGNLLWMVFVLHSRPGLKFMVAEPSLFWTSIMINRLTLSLKKAGSINAVEWGIRVFEGGHGITSSNRSLSSDHVRDQSFELGATRKNIGL